MLSLYEFLGRPIGSELGGIISAYAKVRNQPRSQKWVETPKYKGYVTLYSKEFLTEFFRVKGLMGLINKPNNRLPELIDK